MSLHELIRAARGEAPADLVLKNARIVNTFTREVEAGDVATLGERIAGVGSYRGREEIDLKGRLVVPGFINGHVHLESSHLSPAQFARAVVPRGTVAIVTDLHEVANVAGLAGMRYLLNQARHLPLEMILMVPSCVPATPQESAGARLGEREVRAALRWRGAAGLGEVMDFPSVLGGREVLEKVARARGRPVDGHAPGLSGRDLNAYVAAGIGSDHESVTRQEGEEKLRRGMFLMLRQGSSEKNLEALLPLVNPYTAHRCLLVTDDRSPADLLREGDMDALVRQAIALGLDPLLALIMATLTPAQYFRREGMGAVAPGYFATLLVLSDLTSVAVEMVFCRGKLVAQEGRPLFPTPLPHPSPFSRTVNIAPLSIQSLHLPASKSHLPAIQVVPGQIVTRRAAQRGRVVGGEVVAEVERDLLKLAVVERHQASGRVGVGLVKGFGLKRGALASSIAHDSHNLIAVGARDEDMLLALQEVARLQGGLVAAAQGKVLGSLPLPLFGLLSPAPAEEVAAQMAELENIAAELGCRLPSPFSALSFLALPVIPELRLTDRGLVDGATGEVIG